MYKTFIIVEAGVNHNGDFSLAKKLIDVALDAGVDAVKFQTWHTELLLTSTAKQVEYQEENTGRKESQYDMEKRLELSYNDFNELKVYCDSIKRPSLHENKNKEVVRKRIVAKKEIQKGDILTEDNMTIKRAGHDISVGLWDEMLGLPAQKNYKKDASI